MRAQRARHKWRPEKGVATPRSRESWAAEPRTHSRARACMRAPWVRERVSWVMSALWYRCINLTKRRINLITSQRMSRRMMYRRRDERDVFREGKGKEREGEGDIWTHDVFFVPPTYGGCLILCKHASHPMEKREEKRADAHMARFHALPLFNEIFDVILFTFCDLVS